MSRITSKAVVILTVLAGVGLVVLAGGRPWVGQTVSGIPGLPRVDVTGSQSAPAGTALALVAAAGAVALAITGRIARRVVAVLLLLAGIGVVVLVAGVFLDPDGALAPALETATGRTVAAGSVHGAELTLWPWVGVLGGGLVVLGALVALAGAGRWESAARRFEAPAVVGSGPAITPLGPWNPSAEVAPDPAEGAQGGPSAAGAARRERVVDDWDALTRGEDPTQG